MKIIFNNTIFFSQKFGGISRYITCLAESLVKKNIDVKIVAPIYKNQYLKKISKELISGCFIKRFPNLKIIEKFNNFLFKKNIFFKDSKIIHDTYYSQSLLNVKNKKKVLTIYDMIHEKFPNLYSGDLISHRKKIIYQSDFFICISKQTQKDFLNFYNIKKERTKVIYLGAEHITKESNIINKKEIRFINLSAIKDYLLLDFDGDFYLEEYSDVKLSGIPPQDHYLQYGFFEKRLKFNGENYIQTKNNVQKYLEDNLTCYETDYIVFDSSTNVGFSETGCDEHLIWLKLK